jgi:hypothetical protein
VLIVAAQFVLWSLVLYLLLLGIAAVVRPPFARAFLFGFAQTRRANNIEGLARLAVGLSFIILDKPRSWSPWALAIGLFLVVSAIALLLLSDLHKRAAPRLVSLVSERMPLLGLASLLLAALLTSFLWRS